MSIEEMNGEVEYPPLSPKKLERLKVALRLTPQRFREDALQTAWVAYLEHKSPVAAVNNYTRGEWQHERRFTPLPE